MFRERRTLALTGSDRGNPATGSIVDLVLTLLTICEVAEPLTMKAAAAGRVVVDFVAGTRIELGLVRQYKAERAWILAATTDMRGLHPS